MRFLFHYNPANTDHKKHIFKQDALQSRGYRNDEQVNEFLKYAPSYLRTEAKQRLNFKEKNKTNQMKFFSLVLEEKAKNSLPRRA